MSSDLRSSFRTFKKNQAFRSFSPLVNKSGAGGPGGGGGGWPALATYSYLRSTPLANKPISPRGLVFAPDGLTVYILGRPLTPVEGRGVHQYSLSTAWDITTYSFVATFTTDTQDTNPYDVAFSSDGTIMFVLGSTSDSVYSYNLGTAWDISTAVFSTSFSVTTQDTNPLGFDFKPDGTMMFVSGSDADAIHQYNLGTPWDISTAVFVDTQNGPAISFSVAEQDTSPLGVKFKPDGTVMYVVGGANDSIYRYNFSTPWDITTATFANSAAFSNAYALEFSPDGTKLYIIDSSISSVTRFDLSVAWDITTATLVGSSLGPVEPDGFEFKPDGTSLFVVSQLGSNNEFDAVLRYDLSVAWDISTASQVSKRDIVDADIDPGFANRSLTGIRFNPDGTSMYIAESTTEMVYRFNLSVAWDITTAVLANSLDIDAMITVNQMSGIFFKPDGTTLYVSEFGNSVRRFNLSTPWDITTGTYIDSWIVSPEINLPSDVVFNPDGTSMYVIGESDRDIYKYDMSTPWDFLTMSESTDNINVLAQESSPTGLAFKPDGSTLFVLGFGSEAMHEYIPS